MRQISATRRHGAPASDEAEHGGLNFGKRTGVHVHPTAEWFNTSRIGYIRAYDGGCENHVSLPYQIARHVLEDARRVPQYVILSFGKLTDKSGEVTYPIFGFDLSDPLD